MRKSDDKYWSEYDGLQHAKHQLLKRYLGGWFPILSSCQGKILYIDCHAGRGRHDTGDEGSPILALKLLLNHIQKERIISNCDIYFLFFKNNDNNYNYLCEEIKLLGEIPKKVHVSAVKSDFEKELTELFEDISKNNLALIPIFAFVDPYGFSLSIELLNHILSFSRSEILVNFMYRYIDMALFQPDQSANLNRLFGTNKWEELIKITDIKIRSIATIQLFTDQLKAEYKTKLYMNGSNKLLKYVLIHSTNHKKGRDVIKQAIWSVTPDGSFTAIERNDPNQQVLITPEPDLRPLEDKLWENYSGKSVSMIELYEWLLSEIFLKSHLHCEIR